MARDAQLAGDRVQTETYLQYADHYFRVLNESRARFEEQRPRTRDDYEGDDDYQDNEAARDGNERDGNERDGGERDGASAIPSSATPRDEGRERPRREREREPPRARAEARAEARPERDDATAPSRHRHPPSEYAASGHADEDEAPATHPLDCFPRAIPPQREEPARPPRQPPSRLPR